MSLYMVLTGFSFGQSSERKERKMVQLVKDYGFDIKWNIGSLFAHDKYVWSLLGVIKELGYNNPIKYVFGSTPCLFQGGRIPPRDAEISDALRIIDKYNDYGVGCRLTYSNYLLKEEDLEDGYCNTFLEHLNKGNNNGVILSSDILAKYIKDKYPNLQLIASQVKHSVEVGLGHDTVDYYNKLFDLYDLVVINPFKVQDMKFLSEIKYPERVEFIANHRCVPNCPLAKVHYETQMKLGMKALNNEDISIEQQILEDINQECLRIKKTYPLVGISFSQSDIEELGRMGFTQFKLEGRDNDGVCFIRDMGDYIFIPHIYQRISNAIMGIAV